MAQQSLQVNPAETVAQLAGQVPLTPSPSAPQQFQTPEQTIQSLQQQFDAVVQALKAKGVNAQYTLGSIAPTYQETPEQRAQRIEKELAVYQKRLEKWELLNPVNAVTITKAKR